MVEQTNAIQNSNIDGFKMYPNPNYGQFTLELFSEFSGGAGITITDVSGKIIKQLNSNGNNLLQIDMNDANPGIYFITVKQNDKLGTVKFSIVR